MKFLGITLEKRKGLILGKLKTIQLCKVDLQVLMRMGIRVQNIENKETSSRFSQLNYGLRKAHSIDKAALKKILINDASVRCLKLMTHNT